MVCQYGPAGNYDGEWKNNVLAPKDGKKDLLRNPAGKPSDLEEVLRLQDEV